MKDIHFTSTMLVMGLPIILVYLLAIVRIIERRFARDVDDEFRRPLFSYTLIDIRDAALVTLALDFAEFVKVFTPSSNSFTPEYVRQDIVIVGVLVVFHMTTLFMGLFMKRHEISEKSYLKSTAFNRLFQTYIALLLLLTNAVTIKGIVGAL